MSPLDRGAPAPKSGPDIWVRRLKAEEKITFACCSPSIWEFWIHWAGDKSEPCLKNHKECPGHRRGLPRKWRGYIYILSHNSRRMEFLEITPYGAQQLHELCGDLTSLRGKRFAAARGKGDKARVYFSALSDWSDFTTGKLPEDLDPEKTLLKIWGYDDIDPRISA